MQLRINIDDLDLFEIEGNPLTLQVFIDDEDGTLSRFAKTIEGDETLVGASIPSILRDLASLIENGHVDDLPVVT